MKSSSKKRESINNFASNQGDHNTNNGFLDINGHFKAEMLERNKLTCSFRKLKSNNVFSDKSSNAINASNNGLIDENNSNYTKPPFQYASINNKTQNNNYNTFNSNLNKSILNNYNTRETISKKITLYQSVNQSILNCSSLAVKIFRTKQEQTAKNIEDGFEKLQKLARNLKIIECNYKNSKLVNSLKYEDLFDILEFKGMEKERDIIDKNVNKKKMRINAEIRKPFKSTRNLTKITTTNFIKIDEENAYGVSDMKRNYTKNNYESDCKINFNEKETNYNSDREIPTFNKENFLSLATFNLTNKKVKDIESINFQKQTCKRGYITNGDNRNDRLNVLDEKSIFSKEKEIDDKDKISILTKLRQLEGIENDEFTDDILYNEIENNEKIMNNPFKLSKNLNTASKGIPPWNANLFTSNKKKDFPPRNFTTNKKQKVNEFYQSPSSRNSFKITKSNKYNFHEKIEMAAKIPFEIKIEENNSKKNFSYENIENTKKEDIKKQLESKQKNLLKITPIILNQYEEANRISEKDKNYYKLDSNISEIQIDYKKKKDYLQNSFKKQNQNFNINNNYSNANKKQNNYSSNYASNNFRSNSNSNMKETSLSLIYKTNDNNFKSNYDSYDLKETINENSNITSGSIISCNMDFDSNIRSNNLNNYNGDTYNMKTNDIYGSNSFGDYNSENAIRGQFWSNLSNLEQKNVFKSSNKNFTNDFDNYEEYESAMRKMEIVIDDLPKKGNRIEKKSNNIKSISRANYRQRYSVNSNTYNNATESDYISDFSKNSRLSNNSQNNNSYITKSSVSDNEI